MEKIGSKYILILVGGFFITGTLEARVNGPSLLYQLRSEAAIKSNDENLSDAKVGFTQLQSNLMVPLWKKDLVLTHQLIDRKYSFSNLEEERQEKITGLGVQNIGLIIRPPDIGKYKPILFYSQVRDISFSFSRPVHIYAMGLSLENSFIADLLGAHRSSELLFLARVRQFPSKLKPILIARQILYWPGYRLLLLFPGELRLTKILSHKHEMFTSLRATLQNVMPYKYEDVEAWNVEGLTASLSVGYDRHLHGPFYLSFELGYHQDRVGIEKHDGTDLEQYETEFSPWGQFQLKTVF